MIHGVYVGKFYPFHTGHLRLINEARSHCDVLTVLLVDNPTYNAPGAVIRENWIRSTLREGTFSIAAHASVNVVTIPDLPGIDDSRTWALHAKRYVPQQIDEVYSSEEYGIAFANELGAVHRMIDHDRVHVPISGTQIRKNPLAYLEYLPPVVRSYYVKRVAIVGAESTGKTTLAKALAAHYRTSVAWEYGRLYSEGKLDQDYAVWLSEEFLHIAIAQAMLEDQLARRANKVLICDTDPFATSIWHQRYMGNSSEAVELVAQSRFYDLTLLTGDEIPFAQDGTRDGEHIRHQMHGWFIDKLQRLNRPYLIVSGYAETRLLSAIEAIDRLLSGG